jgi:hypothetical protein
MNDLAACFKWDVVGKDCFIVIVRHMQRHAEGGCGKLFSAQGSNRVNRLRRLQVTPAEVIKALVALAHSDLPLDKRGEHQIENTVKPYLMQFSTKKTSEMQRLAKIVGDAEPDPYNRAIGFIQRYLAGVPM